MRMVVLGLGCVGATHAAYMAKLGHEVLGVEVDSEWLDRIAVGEVPLLRARTPGTAEEAHRLGQVAGHQLLHRGSRIRQCLLRRRRHPQKKGEYRADLRYVNADEEKHVPLLTLAYSKEDWHLGPSSNPAPGVVLKLLDVGDKTER